MIWSLLLALNLHVCQIYPQVHIPSGTLPGEKKGEAYIPPPLLPEAHGGKYATSDERPGTAPQDFGSRIDDLPQRPSTSLGVGTQKSVDMVRSENSLSFESFSGVGRISSFLLHGEDSDADAVSAAVRPHLAKFRSDRTRLVHNKMFRPAAVPPQAPPTIKQMRLMQEQLFGPPNFVSPQPSFHQRPSSSVGTYSRPVSREASREASVRPSSSMAFSREVSREFSSSSVSRPATSPAKTTASVAFAAQIVRQRHEEDYSGQDVPISVSMLSPAPLIAAQPPLGAVDSRPGTAEGLRAVRMREARNSQGGGRQSVGQYDLVTLSEPSYESVTTTSQRVPSAKSRAFSPQRRSTAVNSTGSHHLSTREIIRERAVSPQRSRSSFHR